jgi:hypothetical protein
MLAMCTKGPCEPETQLTVTVCRILQLDTGATQGHRDRKDEGGRRENKKQV